MIFALTLIEVSHNLIGKVPYLTGTGTPPRGPAQNR